MVTLSIAQLRKHNACNLHERIRALSAYIEYTPNDDEEIPFSTWAEVTSFVPDLIWALRCVEGGGQIAAEVARRCAERAQAYANACAYAASAAATYAATAAATYASAYTSATYASAAAYYASEVAYYASAYCASERAAQRADIFELLGISVND